MFTIKFQAGRLVALASISLALTLSQSVNGQSEKLGAVMYTAPAGYARTSKVSNVVAFSKVDQASGKFCIITLYGASPGSGNAQTDFAREWKTYVVDTLGAEASPQTETQAEDGWTITAGAAAVDFQGSKALAMMTVMTGFGKTVAVLGVFNDQAYLPALSAFVSGLNIDKTVPQAPAAAATPPDGAKLVIPPLTRQITMSDLVGEWEETARFSTTYVYRSSGSYAGSDTLAFRSKMSFTRDGRYLNDFFAIKNGEKIIDKTAGTAVIKGTILSIMRKGTAKYVMRGWLNLPDATVLTVCGPWFDDDVIPERVFNDPEYGVNLNKNWVRNK